MEIDIVVNNCELENEKSKILFRQWLKAVDKFFEGKNIAEVLQDKKSLCKMFYIQSNSGLSRQKYQKNKKFIEILQRFFKVPIFVPSRNDALNSRDIVSLYKSLASLLDFVDTVGKQSFEDYNPQQDLLNIKSIAILGWHGLSLAQIASIEKESLKNGTSICGIRIDASFYHILNNLSSSSEYRGIPGGRLQKYKSDDRYLFRSITADRIFTENHLSDALKRFNRQAVLFSQKIEFSDLHKNARFISIAEDTSSNSLTQKIKDIFACEAKNVYGFETEYLLWYKDIYLN